MTTFLVIAALIAGGVVYYRVIEVPKNDEAAKGAKNLVCPHCHAAGMVTVKLLTRGKGISGGKAAGAVVTGGLSVAATGLSKNVPTRHLTCGNCKMEWDVA